jgi:hypothetical protein
MFSRTGSTGNFSYQTAGICEICVHLPTTVPAWERGRRVCVPFLNNCLKKCNDVIVNHTYKESLLNREGKNKNRINKSKHGTDFNTSTELWNDQNRIEIQTKFPAENRNALIGKIKDKIIRHGKKVRITIDIAEELIHEIDQIRQSIGVDRSALIKIWLHERVQQEKSSMSSR